jgi:hypothetical protein
LRRSRYLAIRRKGHIHGTGLRQRKHQWRFGGLSRQEMYSHGIEKRKLVAIRDAIDAAY